jgi:hypothetical protein
VFFAGGDETLVFGANTYRAMERFASERGEIPEFKSLTKRGKL